MFDRGRKAPIRRATPGFASALAIPAVSAVPTSRPRPRRMLCIPTCTMEVTTGHRSSRIWDVIGIIQQETIKIGSRANATTTMSAEHSEEPSDDEESFDDEQFKPMWHPGKLRIDPQLRVPGEDCTSRRAKREGLDRFVWTCCGATGIDAGCEDAGDKWQGIKDKYPLPEDHGLPADGDYESELSGNRTGESDLSDDDEEEQEIAAVSDDEDEDEDEEDDEEDAEDDEDEEEDEEDEDDVDADLKDYLARADYVELMGLEVYDEEEAHGPDHYHPGELQGGEEFTEKELRSNVPQRTQPELFEWTCCGALGNERGCEEKDEFNSEPGIKQKYPLPTESKKRRRDDDDDDDEDGWEDEDDEDDEEDEDDEDDEEDAF